MSRPLVSRTVTLTRRSRRALANLSQVPIGSELWAISKQAETVPRVGLRALFTGPWDNPRYGHVERSHWGVTVGHIELDIERELLSSEWDEFVADAPGGDIVQTTAWARFRRTQGFESRRIVGRVDGRIVGGMQVFSRRLGPVTVAYVPYGPLQGEGSDGVAARALEVLQREFRQGAVFLQPPLGSDSIWDRRGSFVESSVNVAPSASLRIDLSVSADEMLMALSKSLRRNLRKSSERRVQIRPGGKEDIALLAKLHTSTASRQGFAPLSEDYLTAFWESLAPGGHARLFVGEVEGEPVAAELFSTFGGVTTARVTGFVRSHEAARVPAALVWEAIDDARSRAERWFDFGGVSRGTAKQLVQQEAVDKSAAEAFKLSFGPQAVLFPRPVEHIPNRLLRIGISSAQSFQPGWRLLKAAADRLRQPTASTVRV